MSETDRITVPKFGSFKPKVISKSAHSETLSHNKHRDGRQPGLSQETRRLTREHDHARKDHGDPKRHHQSLSQRGLSPSPEPVQDELEESKLFIVDRRGDAKNVEYGSLHRYSIPAYHRIGYGRVLGLSPDSKIDVAASSEREVVISPSQRLYGDRIERPLTAKSRANESRNLRILVPATSSKVADEQQDFIPLRPSLKRKRGSESPEEGRDSIDYRSIGEQAESKNQPEDEDLEYASGTSVGETEDKAEVEARQTTALLNKQIKDDPTNLDVWLALIDHQSNTLYPGVDFAALRNTEKRTLADIRLSIYNRALKHITKGRPSHERLVLGSIEEGSMIWEGSKLAAKWTEVLKENPSSTLLWTNYLDFVQADHLHFRYERCKAAYFQCLKILDTALRNAPDAERAGIATASIYVLVRFTAFVRDAGYEELSFAVWQVLLEYHLFKPPDLVDREAALESLEAFWESDVPRIGEEDAPGWNQFVAGDGSHTRRPTRATTTPVDSKQPYASFSRLEAAHLGTLLLPAATDDDSETSEPFRFVMFSDLREVIGYLLDDIPKAGLINGFLCFMRLPSLQDDKTFRLDRILQADSFLRSVVASQGTPPSSPATLHSKTHGMQCEVLTTFSLFHGAFRRFDESLEGSTKGEAVPRFVDRVLAKLVSAQGSHDLLKEYHLALKLEMFPDEVFKVAKRYLKASPSDLSLYNAYALTEARLDRLSKAQEVWSTALKIVPSLTEEAKDDAILLWHSWMLTLVHSDDDAAALGCLLSMPGGDAAITAASIEHLPVTAGQRLKTSRHLEERFEQMCFKQMFTHAVLYADCMAWLSYLTDIHALEPALHVYEKFAAKLSGGGDSLSVELMHQARARMLKLHMDKRRPYKPAMLRAELTKSIELFLSNNFFLHVHAQVGAQSRLDDRLHDAVRASSTSRADFSHTRWLFSITEEIRRCTTEASSSTQNSVRSLFSAALLATDSKVKHSPALWTLWFRFETSLLEERVGQLSEPSGEALRRAKNVLHDGLRHLPWYKPWIIMGLSYFSSCAGMREEELRQVYDVLADRELRTRAEGIENLS